MLIDDYELTLTCPPCDPGSERWSAFAALKGDISEALPYLNAVWPDAVYDHGAKVLTRRAGGHAVAIRPQEVAVGNVLDRGDAQRLVEELIAQINDVWARRGEITPRIEKRRRLTPMDVYRLLPKTNCQACGEPTCFIFATKLVAGLVKLRDCALLQDPEYAEQWAKLEAQFAPAIGRKDSQ